VVPVTSHAISPCAYVNFSLVEKLNSRAREFFSRLEHFETRAFRDSFTSLLSTFGEVMDNIVVPCFFFDSQCS